MNNAAHNFVLQNGDKRNVIEVVALANVVFGHFAAALQNRIEEVVERHHLLYVHAFKARHGLINLQQFFAHDFGKLVVGFHHFQFVVHRNHAVGNPLQQHRGFFLGFAPHTRHAHLAVRLAVEHGFGQTPTTVVAATGAVIFVFDGAFAERM